VSSHLKLSTKILPSNAGIAKFKSHIRVVITTIVRKLTPVKLKSQMATEPFMTQSKIVKLGIMEAIKYIQNNKAIAVKYVISIPNSCNKK
jgi:hypothetical protein